MDLEHGPEAETEVETVGDGSGGTSLFIHPWGCL